MNRIILSPTDGVLRSEMFNAGTAIYVIKGECTVKSRLILPQGSTLLIEDGSVGLSNAGATGAFPNGIYPMGERQIWAA